jgi:hypothetical protein
VTRRPRFHADRRTREVVTWTIGVVVVLALWLLGSLLLRHLGSG